VALAVAAPAQAEERQKRSASIPQRAALVQGRTLGGIALGDRPADVRAFWGTDYVLCRELCAAKTWLYFLPEFDDPVGIAVSFDETARVSAVFTLGAPLGWRTREGLRIGDDVHQATALYPGWKGFRGCIGYAAMSTRQGGVVTSIFIHGEDVYGFALTLPGARVCQ
jgi:hypothetical protein